MVCALARLASLSQAAHINREDTLYIVQYNILSNAQWSQSQDCWVATAMTAAAGTANPATPMATELATGHEPRQFQVCLSVIRQHDPSADMCLCNYDVLSLICRMHVGRRFVRAAKGLG